MHILGLNWASLDLSPLCFSEGFTNPRDEPDLTLSLPETLFTLSMGIRRGDYATGDSCRLILGFLTSMLSAVSLLILDLRLVNAVRWLLNVGLMAFVEQSSMNGRALSPLEGSTKLTPTWEACDDLSPASFLSSSDGVF